MRQSIFKPSFNLFLIFSLLTLTTHAQNVQFGVKAGLGFAELMTSGRPTTIVDGNTQTMRYYPITTFTGGAFASVLFGKKWSLQPEVVYSLQGATGRPEQDYYVTATEDYRLSYLNVPVLVKYKLPQAFFVETGPQVGLLLSGKINETLVGSVNSVHYDIKRQLKSTDLSWAVGLGYCSPFNLGFDARYNLGLENVNQATSGSSTAPIPAGTLKNSMFQLGVFYIFGKKLYNPPPPPEI
ncbi:MAG: PorT family protein [Sphingobacteriales bacterium]|nr:PorT family protein [Sphingobacteriales bacterium]